MLCLHGVPASAFLYRKVIAELAALGLRGVAIDLPGLGLADRPEAFDYSWSGLGRFCVAAVDTLELSRFHLVVHDIGSPVGFELAAAMPDRIASLTVLNTIVDVDGFRRPWSMEPFATPIGPDYLRTLVKPAFRALMRLQGIKDMSAVRSIELDAYVDLLKRQDGGRVFLQIMRGFERTAAKQALYRSVLADKRYPEECSGAARTQHSSQALTARTRAAPPDWTASTPSQPNTSCKKIRPPPSPRTSHVLQSAHGPELEPRPLAPGKWRRRSRRVKIGSQLSSTLTRREGRLMCCRARVGGRFSADGREAAGRRSR